MIFSVDINDAYSTVIDVINPIISPQWTFIEKFMVGFYKV